MKQRGFTLIEVVISLMILSVLAMLTTNAIRRAIDNRELVSTDVARDAKLADALRVMRTDISAAYHHRDIAVALENAARAAPSPTPPKDLQPEQLAAWEAQQEQIRLQREQANGGQPPMCTDENGKPRPCVRPTPVTTTGFVGDGSSLYFTSLSNVRTLRDSAESNQAKIGYFTKACQVRSAGKLAGSNCLYRSLTPILDKEITTPGPETILLENVEQFQLRYLGPGQDDYVDSWKTGEGAPAATKDVFPYAVEVTVTTLDKNDRKDKKSTASALIPLWFPNNEKKKTKDNKTMKDDLSVGGED